MTPFQRVPALLFLLLLSTAVPVESIDRKGVLILGGIQKGGGGGMEALIPPILADLLGTAPATDRDYKLASRMAALEGNLTRIFETYPDILMESDYHDDNNNNNKWAYVVLQEDMEVPGYMPPDDNDSREDMYEVSEKTILELTRRVHVDNQNNNDVGSSSSDDIVEILLQTPAFLDAATNYDADIYSSFDTMQRAINRGYKGYYEEIVKEYYPSGSVGAPGSETLLVAPCGVAFTRIYDGIQNPLKKGSLLDRLYLDDRKNLSTLGEYVCALVVVQTMNPSMDVRQITYQPFTGIIGYAGITGMPGDTVALDTAERKILTSAAYNAVKEYSVTRPSKRYSPHEERNRTKGGVIFKCILASLVGGAALYGFVAWKWVDAAGAAGHHFESGYALLPTTGMADAIVMEMTDKRPSAASQLQPLFEWINPV